MLRSPPFAWLMAGCLAVAGDAAAGAHGAGDAADVPAVSSAPGASRAAMPLPFASPVSQQVSQAGLDALHGFLRDNTGTDGYLGGVVLVARHGRIVDWQATGFRDLARTQSLRRDDIFRIYSMTKAMTSVAAMQLVEQGKLSLDDPAARWLPEFAALRVVAGGTAEAPRLRAPARPMLVRHLLTHTAGFPAGLPGDAVAQAIVDRDDPHGAGDLAGFVARAGRGVLAADPGTRFGYEAANLEALARIVEVASGEDFAHYLQAHVFAPLRLRDTGFRVPEAQRARVVDITRMGTAHRLERDAGPSGRHPGEPLNAYASGAGGLYSTAGDYARFCQMLLDGGALDGRRVLSRASVAAMFANQLEGILDPPVDQYSAGEGFGFGGYVVLDPATRGTPGSVGTYGWSGAASTNFAIDRKEGMIAILLLQHLPNGAADDLPRIGRRVQALAYAAVAGAPSAMAPAGEATK